MKVDSYVRFMFFPTSYETPAKKALSMISTVAIGIITLSILHMASAIIFRDKIRQFRHLTKESTDLPKRTDTIVPSVNQAATPVIHSSTSNNASTFFRTVTPANVDALLDVTTSGWCLDIKPKLLTITKYLHQNSDGNSCTSYGISFQYRAHDSDGHDAGWICDDLKLEDGKFKCRQNGTPDTYHRFDNLDDYLRYLFLGNFYQGEFFRSNFFLIRKKDGSEIKYQNPFG